MRTILKFTVPVEAGNAAIKNGKMAQITQNTLKQLNPEAAYFYANKGRRGGFMVFDLKDPSDIPSIVEPLFLELNASVDLAPCMSAGDLEKALAKVKV
jgi:hypothetical protein